MGKTRFAPHTRRFAHVPVSPALYVAELSNGAVKVGATGCARGRMMSLANEVKRVHGADLLRIDVFPKATAKAAYEAETSLLRCIEDAYTPLPGSRETFPGLCFDFACELAGVVRGVAYRPRVPA